MTNAEKITEAYASAQNYPDLAARLINAGVISYTVEVSSHVMLYRFANGVIHLAEQNVEPTAISPVFNEALTIETIRNNQLGKTTFHEFMLGIASAGVRFYEATLSDDPRVTYIGIGGFYEERIAL